MGSKKAILILGLLAMVLLIVSEVAARDLTEASSDSKEAEVVEKTNEMNDAKYGGGYSGGGGRGGGYDPGHGGHGGGGYYGGGGGRGHGGRGGGGGGGYCRHGCCDHGYHGGCRRCCHYAGEAVAAQTEDKTQN